MRETPYLEYILEIILHISLIVKFELKTEKSIEAQGVVPDIEMEDKYTIDDVLKAIKKHMPDRGFNN